MVMMMMRIKEVTDSEPDKTAFLPGGCWLFVDVQLPRVFVSLFIALNAQTSRTLFLVLKLDQLLRHRWQKDVYPVISALAMFFCTAEINKIPSCLVIVCNWCHKLNIKVCWLTPKSPEIRAWESYNLNP